MIYAFGNHELDDRLYQLRREGKPIDIEPRVFDVLVYLLQHREQIVSKDELLDKLWPDQVVTETALTRCIVAARKAVGDDGNKQQIIKTQHGRGYRFVASVTERSDELVFQFERTEEPLAPIPLFPPSPAPVADDNASCSPVAPAEARGRQEEEGLSRPLQANGEEDPVQSSPERYWSRGVLALTGLLLLVGIIVIVQYLSFSPQAPSGAIPPEQPRPLPLPDKPSIVVLPFTNLSGDPEQEYFSNGLTDDLITDFSKISGLFVIARHSAFTYKGKIVEVQEISKELGVRYILEGSVRKIADRVRINAQLVDALTGRHLWAERYDRPLKDIFAVQDEIRQQIVSALRVEVFEADLERVQRIPTEKLTAYDSVLRGRDLYFRLTKEANVQAQQMFEQAIGLDSKYAEAYAWMGWAHFTDWLFQWNQEPQILERAFEMAQKAVVFDDTLPFAHLTLGNVFLWKKQHDQAFAEQEKAIALDPNCAACYSMLGDVLIYAGQPEGALKLKEKAIRLSPKEAANYFMGLGMAYRWMGRYEEAIAACKKALIRYPDFLGAQYVLAMTYSELGRKAEARAAAAEVLRLSPHFSLEVVRQQLPHKDPAKVERELTALRQAGLK